VPPGGADVPPTYFQERLSLDGFVTNVTVPPPVYRLYAVVVHTGWSVSCGHYYAFVRDAKGRWSVADDARVSPIALADVLRSDAYMLSYIRERPRVRSHALRAKEVIAAVARGDSVLAGPSCKRKAAELSASDLEALRVCLGSERKRLRRSCAGTVSSADLMRAWDALSMADVLCNAPAGLHRSMAQVARSALLATVV
jgi:hypothetical protein